MDEASLAKFCARGTPMLVAAVALGAQGARERSATRASDSEGAQLLGARLPADVEQAAVRCVCPPPALCALPLGHALPCRLRFAAAAVRARASRQRGLCSSRFAPRPLPASTRDFARSRARTLLPRLSRVRRSPRARRSVRLALRAPDPLTGAFECEATFSFRQDNDPRESGALAVSPLPPFPPLHDADVATAPGAAGASVCSTRQIARSAVPSPSPMRSAHARALPGTWHLCAESRVRSLQLGQRTALSCGARAHTGLRRA